MVELLASSIIERAGAYVGFFALLGLGILALLYFSQARDVRRLREWAGRAPERAAETESRSAQPAATQSQTVVRKPAPAAGATAAATQAGATAPATAAGKAAAAPGPATPADVTASGAAVTDTKEAATGSENGDEPARDHDQLDEPDREQLPVAEDQPVADQPTVAHTPVESLEPYEPDRPSEELEPLPPFEPLPSDEHYLPGTSFRDAGERRRKPLRKRVRNIHIPGGATTLAVLGGAVALVIGLSVTGVLGGGDGDDQTAKQTQRGARGQSKGGGSAAAVEPGQVTVAVLNGTTTTGLAYRVSQEAKTGGFQLGNVTNAATTDQTKSEVLYAPGQKDAARAVADRLGIATIAPIDSVNAEIAGSSDAIVLVGADRS